MKGIKRVVTIIMVLSLFFSGLPMMAVKAKTTIKKPTISTVKETSNATVTIKWKKVAGVKGYLVYRKEGTSGKYKKLATIKKAKTVKYVDKNTRDNTLYYYAIKSYSGNKKSAMSAGKKIKTSAPSIGTLFLDRSGVYENTVGKVLLTLTVNNDKRIKSKSLAVYENDILKGYLNDKGENGDNEEDDHIYSLRVNINGNAKDEYKYFVKYLEKKTNEETVRVYEALTKDGYSVIDETNKEITNLIDNVSGSASSEVVYSKAKEWEQSGKIVSVKKFNNEVSMIFSNGIHYHYSPESDYLKAGNDDLIVKSLQPYHGTVSWNEAIYDEVAAKISGKFGSGNYNNIDSASVNLNQVKWFGDNQVIIWDGHGGYTEDGPTLCLGEFSTSKQLDKLDLASGEVYIDYDRYNPNDSKYLDGRLSVTGKYIRNHVKSMENSFIFLLTCYSAKVKENGEHDMSLTGAFYDKGATVIGFSDSVSAAYTDALVDSWGSIMLTEDPTSKMYYTAYDALSLAMSAVGEDDSNFMGIDEDHPTYAHPVFVGDKRYRFSNETSAKLTISPTSKTIEVGETFKISVSSDIESTDIDWNVNDTTVVSISGKGKNVTIKGLEPGKTEVICSWGDKQAVCKVTVNEAFIMLDKSNFSDDIYIVNTRISSNPQKARVKDGYMYIYDCSLETNGKTVRKKGNYIIKLDSHFAYYVDKYDEDTGKSSLVKRTNADFNENFYSNYQGYALAIIINKGCVTRAEASLE